METKRTIAESVYALLLISLIALSWSFNSTAGFVWKDSDGVLRYTDELQSSGANDNLTLSPGAFLFTVPILIRVVARAFKRSVGATEILVFALIWIYQLFLLVMLDAGSVYQTALKNFVFLSWLVTFVSIAPVLGVVASLYRDPNRQLSSGESSGGR